MEPATEPFAVSVGEDRALAVFAGAHPGDLGTASTVTLPLRHSDIAGEQCVVILSAFSDAARASAVAMAELEVSNNPAIGRELLTATSNPASEYADRATRWLPLLLGGFGGALTAIIARLRSSEIAVYRMSGSSPSSVLTLLSIEALLVAGVASLGATCAAIVLAKYYIDPSVPVLWGIALAGVWALLAVAGSLDLALRSPSTLAKDR
ncbi:hypothetical protein [Demequina flava]|uniref:hypothetical protein n=1 Tax=Demequina flava TaxID=1095025 RepID=UPI0007833F07|nr:hypothetical protein [Demequina flava]